MEGQEFKTKGTKIKIIGVGGAGGNVINDLISSGIEDVEYTAINTDEQDLKKSLAEEKISIGHLGAGANPEVARNAAEEKKRQLEDVVKDHDMIFITAGMGGGTGTGASPIIARAAKDENILTVAIVTKPFDFEGKKRKVNAENGILELKKYVDVLIVIPNQKLLDFPEAGNLPYSEHLKKSNEIIRFAIRGITELITKQGLINLDFADVEAIMKEAGVTLFGFGESEENETVESLVERTITNPLLERDIKGATKILVNITAGKNITMNHIQEILDIINLKASGKEDGVDNLIYGMIDEPDRTNVLLTVIATGFNDKQGLTTETYDGRAFDNSADDIVPVF
ncbi:cell division protein FtsZ [Oceanivirga miroungae]|uniref:Cell division protein FtsZ n=1 Tax=Oceanivirga miroungae TaxID=1130046 RepID=A0A6I8MFL0_9FUSO|nr:cell division protein FtsZ [Oceanivirga miroungae]VWL85932.1 cell division protein FtsZ [Oceanivirga miroungae]